MLMMIDPTGGASSPPLDPLAGLIEGHCSPWVELNPFVVWKLQLQFATEI